MVNLLGKSEGPAMPSGILECLRNPETHLHVYGKEHSKKGRKMGHLTLLGEDPEAIRKGAIRLAQTVHFGL